MTSETERGDLIYGAPAIAAYLGLRTRQVHHLIEKHGLPVFRLGRRVVARPGGLRQWVRDREAKAEVARETGE